MNSNPTNSRRSKRSGLTLLEILLVMAIVVAIAALVIPKFAGPLSNHRLRRSADLIRADWAKARLTAMKTGRIQVFRFQIDNGQYSIEPYYQADDYLESNALGDPQSGAMQNVGGTFAPQNTTQNTRPLKQLPEGIVFVTGEEVIENRSLMFEQTTGQVSDNSLWSQPILFYPDGQTSTVKLLLRNQRDRFIYIQLRGLTGIAQVGELMRREELLQ